METETDFPAKLWRTGNSTVVTIPKGAIEQLKIDVGSGVMVHLRKWKQ